MGRVLTDEVLTFESVGDNDKYLKHINGKTTSECSIMVGGDDRDIIDWDALEDNPTEERQQIYDFLGTKDSLVGSRDYKDALKDAKLDSALSNKIAFRVKYNNSKQAYYLMPISASNGLSKTVQWTGSVFQTTDDCVNWLEESSNWNNAMLDIELQTDGSYHIKLHSSTNQDLLLTNNGDGNGVTFEAVNSAKKQSWTLDEYMYRSPVPNSLGVYEEYLYSEVEEYYTGLGFISPLANDVILNQTSDFGVRAPETETDLDFHKGVDFEARWINLYSTVPGNVVRAVNEDLNNGMGKYVIINTGIQAYGNSNYEICVVYMHMDEVEVNVNDPVVVGDYIGVSGNTGNVPAHLHYGVFLHPINSSSYYTDQLPLETHWFLPALYNY